MDLDIVEGNWKQFQGKAKIHWRKQIDDHPEAIAGKGAELTGNTQEGFGIKQDEDEKQLKHCEQQNETFKP